MPLKVYHMLVDMITKERTVNLSCFPDLRDAKECIDLLSGASNCTEVIKSKREHLTSRSDKEMEEFENGDPTVQRGLRRTLRWSTSAN